MQKDKEKRAIAFIDGQNLFHTAKEAFGIKDPTYDVRALANSVCANKGWKLEQTRFYTGVPAAKDKPEWHQYWTRKILSMRRSGVWIFTRPLRKRAKTFTLDDGTKHSVPVFEEKGIDVRIALDLVSLAIDKTYDVAIVFSQDQDLSEAIQEVHKISKQQGASLELYSAFPVGRDSKNLYGINHSRGLPIIEADYLNCLDAYDYWAAIRSQNRRG